MAMLNGTLPNDPFSKYVQKGLWAYIGNGFYAKAQPNNYPETVYYIYKPKKINTEYDAKNRLTKLYKGGYSVEISYDDTSGGNVISLHFKGSKPGQEYVLENTGQIIRDDGNTVLKNMNTYRQEKGLKKLGNDQSKQLVDEYALFDGLYNATKPLISNSNLSWIKNIIELSADYYNSKCSIFAGEENTATGKQKADISKNIAAPATNGKQRIAISERPRRAVAPCEPTEETDAESSDTQIDNPITPSPIVFIPGTMGCWKVHEFDSIVNYIMNNISSLKDQIKDREAAIGKLTITDNLYKTALEADIFALNKIQVFFNEKIIKKVETKNYYKTEVNDSLYYVDPIMNSYVDLFEALEKNGKQDSTYFIFGYDTFRDDMKTKSGKSLAEYVDYVLDKTKAKKVRIVAHSQGNLVARTYIELLNGYEKVDTFIMVAPPNRGVDVMDDLYYNGKDPLSKAGWTLDYGSWIRELMVKFFTWWSPKDEGGINRSKQFFLQVKNKEMETLLKTSGNAVKGMLPRDSLLQDLNNAANIEKLLQVPDIVIMRAKNVINLQNTVVGHTGDDGVGPILGEGDGTVAFDSNLLPSTKIKIKTFSSLEDIHPGLLKNDPNNSLSSIFSKAQPNKQGGYIKTDKGLNCYAHILYELKLYSKDDPNEQSQLAFYEYTIEPTFKIFDVLGTTGNGEITPLGLLKTYGTYSEPQQMLAEVKAQNDSFDKILTIPGPIYKTGDPMNKTGFDQGAYEVGTVTVPETGNYNVRIGVNVGGKVIWSDWKTYNVEISATPSYDMPVQPQTANNLKASTQPTQQPANPSHDMPVAKQNIPTQSTQITPTTSTHNPVLQQLAACKTYKEVKRLATMNGFVRGEIGKGSNGFSNPEKCIIAVFSSDGSLAALLDTGNASRTDLLSGKTIQNPEQYYEQAGYYLWYMQQKNN